MTIDATQIRLTVPAAKQTSQSVDTRPGRLRQWLDDLPYADVNAAANQLYKVLFVINRRALAAEQRFTVMELFAEPFDFVANAQIDGLVKPGRNPLHSIGAQAPLLRRLSVEMAFGYKLVARDAMTSDPHPNRNEVLLAAIQKATVCLARILLSHFVTYEPFPRNVWKELHQLYAYAERYDVHETPIDNTEEASTRGGTVAIAYKQILLTSLTDPYTLSNRETLNIFRYLSTWSESATITGLQPMQEPQGFFLIDLESDLTATPCGKLEQAPGWKHRLRLLDTRRLVGIARDQVASLQQGHGPVPDRFDETVGRAGAIRLLEHAVASWGGTRQRRFARHAQSGQIALVPSLEPIYSILGGLDIGALNDVAHAHDAEHGRTDVPDQVPTEHQGFTYAMYEGELANESTGGLAVRLALATEFRPRIGQLVGVRKQTAEPTAWSIGVVRRIRTGRTEDVELGVEYLATVAPRPVALRSFGDERHAGVFRPALMFDPQEGGTDSAAVLANPGTYVPGGRFTAHEHSGTTVLRANRLVTSTTCFDYFHCRLE